MEYSMLIENVLHIETLDAITLKSTIFANMETVIKYITRLVFTENTNQTLFLFKSQYMLYISYIWYKLSLMNILTSLSRYQDFII